MKVLNAVPVLRVTDFASAVSFYPDQLGYTVESEYDDYIDHELDHSQLHLSRPGEGKPAGGGTVYVFCDEVDEYFGNIRARGATPAYGPCEQFYGMRDFMINDPDGNQLTFGRALSAEERARV